MFKKFALSAAVAAVAFSASSAFAAGEGKSLINISADIPTKQFHAQPNDPEFGKAEVMNYNPVTGTLSSLRAVYNVKNTEGSVHAYIEGGPAVLDNGSNSIALATTFNGVTLTAVPQEVVDDAQSTPGTQADLVITPAKPADTQNGLYTASFTVMFDAVPR